MELQLHAALSTLISYYYIQPIMAELFVANTENISTVDSSKYMHKTDYHCITLF